PDHRVLNAFRPQIGSVGVRRDRLCSIIRSFTHGIRNVTDRNTISTVNSLEVAPRLRDSTRHGLATVCPAVVPYGDPATLRPPLEIFRMLINSDLYERNGGVRPCTAGKIR